MATFKAIVYRHHRKSDGTYNVKILLTHKRQKRNLATNVMVDERDLTRSLKIKDKRSVDVLDDILRRCRQLCNEHARVLGDMSVDSVAQLVAHVVEGRADEGERFDLDFISYSRQHVEKLREEGRRGTAKVRANAVNNLVRFIGRETLSVHEITARFIESWIDFIRKGHPRTDGQPRRAESFYPSSVRTILNAAKREFNDEDTGVIRIPLSPFRSVKLPQPPASEPRALDVEVIRAIFAFTGKLSHTAAFAREVFMLSFLLVGMNAADLFTCTDLRHGRITYLRSKVATRRKDRGKISIRVEPEAEALIEKYRDASGQRVFCFYQRYASVDSFNTVISGVKRVLKRSEPVAHGLKELGSMVGAPGLILYAARHSWATIARNRCGVSKDDVALALNHVDSRLSVTDIYIEKDWSLIDAANRKVIDYVLHNK